MQDYFQNRDEKDHIMRNSFLLTKNKIWEDSLEFAQDDYYNILPLNLI